MSTSLPVVYDLTIFLHDPFVFNWLTISIKDTKDHSRESILLATTPTGAMPVETFETTFGAMFVALFLDSM
jgi:hypothetical protein